MFKKFDYRRDFYLGGGEYTYTTPIGNLVVRFENGAPYTPITIVDADIRPRLKESLFFSIKSRIKPVKSLL